MKRALLTLLCSLSALAQWPTDSNLNLLICDHTGEQALPKTAALSEGGCYIAWQDLSSGNYDIYLQRLNSDGVPQWANPCGILISDHPQDTWLTDWDIAADVSDNCILAINDIRNGSDRDITVYSIGPQQEFLWGADGIALSNNDGFEPDPQIEPMSNGDIVFAWQEETSMHLRRLTAQGVDVFNPPTITFTQANGVSIPRLAAADSGAVILSYLAQQGTQFTSPRHLYLRKYAQDGTPLWNPNGVPIMTQNGIGIQMRPDVLYDGSGGAFSYWYDARGNVHHCYVQHVNAAGNVEWITDGVQVDLSANELQMSPSAIRVPAGVAIFYQTANTNQSQGGLDAQLLDVNGARLWNANGLTIAPLSPEPCFNVRAFLQDESYTVFYSQYAPGSQINTLLRASQLSQDGVPNWTPTVKELCSVVSEKGRPHACITPLNQIVAAWPDSRTATMDIFVQNINADGSLGPNTFLPPQIIISSPHDNEIVHNPDIDLVFEVFNYFIDPEFGDGYVSIQLNDQDAVTTDEVAPFPLTLRTGENSIIVEILDLVFQPLEPRVMDSVIVNYVPRNPSITITNPTADTLTFVDIPIRFEVEDFVVGDSTGDGHVLLRNIVSYAFGADTFYYESYTLNPFENLLSFPFFNNICIYLVDRSGNQLDPPAFDCILIACGEIISADPIPDVIPTEFSITSTYPNPFNATLSIQYDIPQAARISLSVYDLLGREVATLFQGMMDPGRHAVFWNAEGVSTGVYFIRLHSEHRSAAHKVLLLK